MHPAGICIPSEDHCLICVHHQVLADFKSCLGSTSSYCSSDTSLQPAVGNQSVLWYIVTDCAGLSLQLRNSWGCKVWVPKGAKDLAPVHIDKLQSSGASLDAADILRGFTAFAEQWFFAMTDYQARCS